jgi:hypothetical protein
MNYSQLSDEVFWVKQIYSEDYFQTISEEFDLRYNHVAFTKREILGQPCFGTLQDTATYFSGSASNNNLGWNYKFIDASIRARLYVQKILKRNVKLSRVNTNLQFFGQESDWHTDYVEDGNAWSFVIYVNQSWDLTWDGQFVVETNDGEYINVSPIPNTGVLFNAKLEHRGGAPNRFAMDSRWSIAFLFEEV